MKRLPSLSRRALMFGSLGLPMAGYAWADSGHGPEGIGVTITSVGPDNLDPNKTAVGVQIDNDRRVDAILRKVESNHGTAELHKTVTVFGRTTRSPIKFFTVTGESTSFLRPPNRQITIDHVFTPEMYLAFGFDFGPRGQIFTEFGTP
ncbi:MAG: hypothetical protein AAGJ34_13620 [Pseudomonadota bacterium]